MTQLILMTNVMSSIASVKNNKAIIFSNGLSQKEEETRNHSNFLKKSMKFSK